MTFPFPRRGRSLALGQTSQLAVIDLAGNESVIFTADEVIKAPNWTPDGQYLIFSAGGKLYRLPPIGGTPEEIDTGFLDDLNNDHVISPDGATAYVSSNDGHLYAVSLDGGLPRRVYNHHATPCPP